MPRMKRPACVGCNVTFKTSTVGHQAMEMDEDHNPIAIWSVDELHCPSCGASILWGWGEGPIAKPTDPQFQDWLRSCTVRFRG